MFYSTKNTVEELKKIRDEVSLAKDCIRYRSISCRIDYLVNREVRNAANNRYQKEHRLEFRYRRAVGDLARAAYRPGNQGKQVYNPSKQRCMRQHIERKLHRTYKFLSGNRMPEKAPAFERLMGCTVIEFKEHISLQLARYNWHWKDWRALWTFDHVVPVSHFTLPLEAAACWHYTNIQPIAKGKNNRAKCMRWI